ncbi:atp-dependent rna helicase ddx24-like protein, partial [Lasius niger]
MNDSEWKPITLEGTLLSNGIEGLIGIEELTDYSLEHIQNKDLQWQNRKKGKIITTEVKSAKKKKSSAKRKCEDEWKEADIDNDVSSVKKLKVKKAKTKKSDEKMIKSTEIKAINTQIDSDSENDFNKNFKM